MHRLRAALCCDLLAVVSNLEARGVLNFSLRPFFFPLSSLPPPARPCVSVETRLIVKTIKSQEKNNRTVLSLVCLMGNAIHGVNLLCMFSVCI